MNGNRSTYHKLERIVRGFSNHRRIEIINLLSRSPELSVFDIANALDVNFKTISEHVRRLAAAELVMKRSEGAAVRHRLISTGNSILKFLRTLE